MADIDNDQFVSLQTKGGTLNCRQDDILGISLETACSKARHDCGRFCFFMISSTLDVATAWRREALQQDAVSKKWSP